MVWFGPLDDESREKISLITVTATTQDKISMNSLLNVIGCLASVIQSEHQQG